MTEIAFIDKTVSGLGTLLTGLRYNVEAVLLDASTPASTQIARALSDRTDIRAIHIVAHGSPGEVRFGAGPLTLANLEEASADLAAIGRALGTGGELRLWSCRTRAGEQGAAFVEALALASGAEVAAAAGLVGAVHLGGRWELAGRSGGVADSAAAPLTDHGISSYKGVMTAGWFVFDPSISSVGGDDIVDSTEAGSSGFKVLGSGRYGATNDSDLVVVGASPVGIPLAGDSFSLTLTFTDNSGHTKTYSGSATVTAASSGDLTWSMKVTSFSSSTIVEGSNVHVKAAIGDDQSSQFNFKYDKTAPSTPSISQVTDDASPLTGTVASGGSTNDTTPTVRVSLSGTGAATGDSVQLYNGTSVLGSAVTLTSSDISAGYKDITTSALSNGTSYSFKAKITDEAGNAGSTSSAYSVTVDTSTPSAPTISQVSDDVSPTTGTVASGGKTNDTTPTVRVSLSGTGAAAGDSVQLYNGASALGSAATLTAADISAGYKDITTSALSNGSTYGFNAKIADAAGNTSSASGTHTVTVDATAPNAPTISQVSDNVSPTTGTVASGGNTNDTTPTVRVSLSGTGAVTGDSVRLYNGASALGSAVSLTASDISEGYKDITTSTLGSATYGFNAKITDAASNTSTASATYTVTVDIAAPSAPSIIQVSDDVSPTTGTVASGGSTNDSNPTVRVSLSGTGAVAGDSVTLDTGPGLGSTGDSDQSTANATVTLTVGGGDGNVGNGGAVSVTHASGALATAGIGSSTIFAQSVGGGGGSAAAGAAAAGGSVAVGGTGGASGNGGAVTVNVTGGSLAAGTGQSDASGVVGSYGIFAQSVGGGGGIAGNVLMESLDSFDSGLAMNADGHDSTGDGGIVDVTLGDGVSLATYGDGSIGVFAQSVGGGGGVAGAVGASPTAALVGSNGGAGTAGAVTVSVDGSIATSGSNAHGVFAQSVGGAGSTTATGTMVQVTVGGSIVASGDGAYGIFAQSAGDGMGAVNIDVESGATVAGSGAGILVSQGTSSTITNYGTIANTAGTDGTAIYAYDTTLTLDNYGTITGNIEKASSIHLTNRRNGVLVVGDLINVNETINRGTIDIGGSGNLKTTAHTGKLIHGKHALLKVDVDPSQGAADRLNIGSTVDLRGRLAVSFMDVLHAQEMQKATIITAASGVSSRSHSAFRIAGKNPAEVLALSYPDQETVKLRFAIDFANDTIQDAANDNQRSLAKYIERLYLASADGLDGYDSLFKTFAAIPDMSAYLAAIDSLGAEVYTDTQVTSLYSSLLFNDSLLSCAERDGVYRFIAEDQCGWLGFQAGHFDQGDTDQIQGFEASSSRFSGGLQFEPAQDWFVGAGVSYEDTTLDQDNGLASGDGWQVNGGLVAKRQVGPALFAASLSFGYAGFDVKRSVFEGSVARGDQDLWLVSGQVRGEYAFERENWYVKPRLDFGVDYLSAGGFTETGAGNLSLDVFGTDGVYPYLLPAVEIGSEYRFASGMVMRPWVSLGLTQFLTDQTPTARAAFVGAPAGLASFTSAADLAQTTFDMNAGVDLMGKSDWGITAFGMGRFADDATAYGGGLKFRLAF